MIGNIQSSRLRNFEVYYENSKEFHHLKREIFGENIYYAEFDINTPNIIDVGAHIGMATMYFKMIYPNARILAIEPLLLNQLMFSKNIEYNRLSDVELVKCAVGNKEEERDFFIDASGEEWFSSSSFSENGWNGEQENKPTKVIVKKLSQFITKKVDLLKLDVEGAEEEVIEEISPKLHMIEKIFFEYHPKRRGTPEKILEILEKAGFETTFHSRGREVDWRKRKGLLMGESVRKKR